MPRGEVASLDSARRLWRALRAGLLPTCAVADVVAASTSVPSLFISTTEIPTSEESGEISGLCPASWPELSDLCAILAP